MLYFGCFIKFEFLLRLDVWDNYAQSQSDTRSGVIGVANIGGICTNLKYSIVEYAGLNSIQNAAHELAHKYKPINHFVYI